MISKSVRICPDCGGSLKYYDQVPRIVRSRYRRTEWIRIRRFHCLKCGHVYRELPVYILPYKQYEAEIIYGVLKGFITSETLGFEDYPCEMTMIRWTSQKTHLPL